MKNKLKTEEEISKTLNILDSEPQNGPGEYFETRLYAKIRQENNINRVNYGWLRPAFTATLVLLLTANVLTALNYFRDDSSGSAVRETKISKVAESYNLINYSIYNY